VGSIIVSDSWWKATAGTLVGLVGLGYVALEYVPSIEPPANMRYELLLICLCHVDEESMANIVASGMRTRAGALSRSRDKVPKAMGTIIWPGFSFESVGTESAFAIACGDLGT
jgi:hypothetical protein